MTTHENDTLVRACSAMNGWADLVHSIEAHGYVPTIYPDGAKRLALRAALLEAGHRVHPPEEHLSETTCYRLPAEETPEGCCDCSEEAVSTAQWSGTDAIPSVGGRVTVTGEGYGPGTVVGHRVEHEWAGIWVELDTPCVAPHTGNDGKTTVFAFGIDLES